MQFAADDGAKIVLRVWIAAAGLIAVALSAAVAGFFSPWLLWITGFIGVLTVFLSLWYPPRYTDSLRGSCDGVAIRAVKGVLLRREVFVPLAALRTFEINATPMQKYFRCRSVVLRFAGGAVLLPLIPKKQAEQLAAIIEKCEC